MDKEDLRYKRGKIYTIICEDGNVYVGSTIQTLNDRLATHRNDDTCRMYKYIHNNYNCDWSKCKIELYENYPCKNKKVLDRKEGEIIQLIGTINKQIAGRTRDEYEEYRKEDKKIYLQNYNKNNKEKIAERNKEHRIKNAEYYKEYERNRKNKKERNEYSKQIIECDCGCLSTQCHKARHQKTKRHQDLMNKQTSAILSFLECF